MSYESNMKVGFALTFLVLLLSGFSLFFSAKLGIILLSLAFFMNFLLFVILFFVNYVDIFVERPYDDSKGGF